MSTSDQLTGRELDAAVAVDVMGWKLDVQEFKWNLARRLWIGADGQCIYHFANWRPSEDLNCASLVEAEIERRGLVAEYLNAILAMIPDRETYWGLLRATPEMRCRAALAAVRGAK